MKWKTLLTGAWEDPKNEDLAIAIDWQPCSLAEDAGDYETREEKKQSPERKAVQYGKLQSRISWQHGDRTRDDFLSGLSEAG